MNKPIVASLVAASLLPASAWAEQNTETVVVIGRSHHADTLTQIPANVAVITQEYIRKSGAQDITALLRGKSGIQVSDTNSGASFAMRGFSGSQSAHNTLVLIDGRRLNKADLSSPQLGSIALSQVERIEILSGSAGVLYGDQAVGGVINIILKSTAREGGHVGVRVGDFDTRGAYASKSGKLSDYWHYQVSADYAKTDNYREHNAQDSGVLSSRLEYQRDGERFHAVLSYFDDDRQWPSSLTESEYRANPRQSKSTHAEDYGHEISRSLDIGYQKGLGDTWQLSTSLQYSDTSSSAKSWGTPSQGELDQLTVSISGEKLFAPNRGEEGAWIVGVDYANNAFDYFSQSAYSTTDRDNRQQRMSVFSQLHYPLSSQTTLVLGGRKSRVTDDLTDAATYPDGEQLKEHASALELGVNHFIDEINRLYIRGEQNFRFAKVDEQAYTSPGVFGLAPQKGKSVELGWRQEAENYQIGVDLYRLEIDDEILFDSSATKPVGGSFNGANVNADRSVRYGGSISGQLHVTPAWLVVGEYHYIDAEFTEGDNKGNALPWVAMHTATLQSTVHITRDVLAYIEGVYTGSRYKDGDNANSKGKLSSYWLSNFGLQYELEQWLTTFRVDNLFDKQYPANANARDAYYPGDGRQLTLEARYSF
ncbi:TonB-dependent receptor [Salinivibrio sp. EAGSL]|uniref:TonB-dependent receptor n=1 Tax=Salinivibrio sp. EAGSL TaxID=2738468 RepID=UPI00158D86F2|nr:TonB-dependent receptor [Salinivibrio sp. EAGSL]NUY57093.1 TonB-dependent receptor [Salinivibrio sp. EAGSL]